jgi:hypothetical protein
MRYIGFCAQEGGKAKPESLQICRLVVGDDIGQIPQCHIEVGVKVDLSRTAHAKPFHKKINVYNLHKSSAHRAKILKRKNCKKGYIKTYE